MRGRGRHYAEFGAVLAAYGVFLFASLALLRHAGDAIGWWRTPLALAPMLPAVAMLIVVVRQLGRLDEFQRRVEFEALAFAFGGTAIATFGYGFLETDAGYPHLSWLFVWPVMAALWLTGLAAAQWRYR